MTAANYSLNRFVAESSSMTGEDVQEIQAQHYNLDDNIRRMMGKLTLDQKQKIADWMTRFLQNKMEVEP